MLKKFLIYLVISILSTLTISYILYSENINKVMFSNSFFVVGILLLILACLSSLVSWSIHKRFALRKLEANQKDIERAKKSLKYAFNYLIGLGSINLIISLILAYIAKTK